MPYKYDHFLCAHQQEESLYKMDSQKCYYPEYKQYILWIPSIKNTEKEPENSEIKERSFLQNIWKTDSCHILS